MKNKYAYLFSYNYLFFHFLILLFKFKFSFSQIINIIQLGGENFRYNHFSLNSKGDMIIDTTANPGSNERRFFGLKKNGRGYFFDENNIETPYRSLFAENLENENQQKLEGESNFIILSNQNFNEIKEYLISFSKLDNYMELYNFDTNEISTEKTSIIFGNNITSNVSTFFKSESKIDNKTNYYIAYIHEVNNEYKFYFLRCYFTSTNLKNKGYHRDTGNRKSTINKAITSCFETEQKKIACFYQKNNLKYTIVTIDEDFNNTSQNYTTIATASEDINTFFKAIHFKKEIGAFIYYINITDIYPIFSLKYCSEEDNIFYNYKNYEEIIVNKMSFNSNAMMNDIIKVEDNKICFISISSDKNSLIIVIFNTYNEDNYMSIRYYSNDMYNLYRNKFFNDLRIFNFNGFISAAYSYCPQLKCNDNEDLHYSSLIIFSYPNITTDQNANLLEYIYTTNNKFEDYNFILDEHLNCYIENNIFGHSCKGIKILNYPENTILKYKKDNNIVEKNSFLVEKEILFLFFEESEEYKGMNYTIEYAYVGIDPEYSKINTYISEIDNSYGNEFEQNYYEKKEYIGRSAYFNLTIEENLTSICNDKCILCYKKDINYCVICRYNYTFNGNEKICFSIIESTIPLTTILTTSKMTTIFLPSTFLAITTEIQTTIPYIIPTTNLIIPETSLLSSSIITFSSLLSTSEFLQTTFPVSSTNLQNEYSSILKTSPILSTNFRTEYSTIITTFPIISTNIQTDYSIILSSSPIISTNIQNEYSTIISTSPIISTNIQNEYSTSTSQIISTNIQNEYSTIISTSPIISTNIQNEYSTIISTSQIISTNIQNESLTIISTSQIISTNFHTEYSAI